VIVHDEHQRQGASNVTVRNIITSMRLLSDVDWPEFFESVSLVDEALRAGSDFAAMDFPSRTFTGGRSSSWREAPIGRSWRLRKQRWRLPAGSRMRAPPMPARPPQAANSTRVIT